jgi:hypothetical protein
MSMHYTKWIFHGEAYSDNDNHNEGHGAYASENDEEYDDTNRNNYVDDAYNMVHELEKSGKKGPNQPNFFPKLMDVAKRELHEGCTTYTRLAFNMKLLHIKTYKKVTNKAFDLFLSLLCAALPWVDFPKTYADAKSVLSEVGLVMRQYMCASLTVLCFGEITRTIHIVRSVGFQDGGTQVESRRCLTRI